ncbi:hypothetical protein [Caballeronia glathei]|jgi:hypothetical protein|uniref:hypothetical protein n=1 Tax=Caballeronia glathei TaxID=60547 RepID=UPI00101A2E10|nr:MULTISPECIES: hypothetical protein [Burkholderiaceae]
MALQIDSIRCGVSQSFDNSREHPNAPINSSALDIAKNQRSPIARAHSDRRARAAEKGVQMRARLAKNLMRDELQADVSEIFL